MGVDIEATLQSLTLEEKIALLAGKDFWETVPVPGKGVPAIKVWPHIINSGRSIQLTLPRQAMAQTVLVVKSSLEAREQHVSRQQSAQRRHSTQNMLKR